MPQLTPFGERVARILHRRPHLGLEGAKKKAMREIEDETQRWIKQVQSASRGFNKEESEGYGAFIESFFDYPLR